MSGHSARVPGQRQKPKPSATPDNPQQQQQLIRLGQIITGIQEPLRLFHSIVNDPRDLLGFQQAFFLVRRRTSNRLKVEAVSDISSADRDVPMLRWIEDIAGRIGREAGTADKPAALRGIPGNEHGWMAPVGFMLPAYSRPDAEETRHSPFRHLCWLPMFDQGRVVGALLLTSSQPWHEKRLALANSVVQVYHRQWLAIAGRGRLIRRSNISIRFRWLAAALAVALLFLPVRLTVLAPVQVVPKNPFIMTAPFSGVVESILVEPNTQIATGQTLVRFDDLELRNQFEIATQQVEVHRTRYKQVAQRAISDTRAKADLLIARSELDLAEAEMLLAKERLSRTTLTAPQSGTVVFSSKRDWQGRPVQTGEAIVQIADASTIEFRIELPVKDSIILENQQRVRLYLDSAPLQPLEARIVSTPYLSSIGENGAAVFTLTATRADADGTLPRIGVRGTAQVFGDSVPFIFTLLRRPITALRQWAGI